MIVVARNLWRGVLVASLLFTLAACGGGGGDSGSGGSGGSTGGGGTGGSGSEFSLSTTSLTFNAESPTAPAPASQQVLATVSASISGTLYILVEVAGQGVTVAGIDVTGPTTGSGTVTPAEPNLLGSGTFTSTLTVRACVNSPTCASGQLKGSPRTVNVTYTVGSTVQQPSVSPRLVPSNAGGSVILRGSGFTDVTAVSFGTTPATSFTVRSATEIVADYPALAQGNYPVSLTGAAAAFDRSLVVQDGVAFAATSLAYPEPPEEIASMVYDDEHQALLLAARYADKTTDGVLRYAYSSGVWNAPTSTTIFDVRDVGLLPDGQTLLVMSGGDIRELNSTTFSPLYSSVNRLNFQKGTTDFMRSMAVANDGNVVITSDVSGIGQTLLYVYATGSRTFSDLERRDGANVLLGYAVTGMVGASADGSRVVSHSAKYSAGEDLGVVAYSPVTGLLSGTPLAFDASHDYYRPSLSRDGSRIVLSNGTTTQVFAGDYSLYCWLPNDTRAYVVNPDGTRVYTLNDQSQLLAFTINPGGGNCSQTGATVSVTDPGVTPIPTASTGRVQMTISRDGQTLFMAGVNGVLVRPVP